MKLTNRERASGLAVVVTAVGLFRRKTFLKAIIPFRLPGSGNIIPVW
jgi:hypothetical protein